MRHRRPVIGLLYNPVTPEIVSRAGELVEYFVVTPDRLWQEFGASAPSGLKFHRALGAIDQLKRLAAGRIMAGHGLGLSAPGALPPDDAFIDALGEMSQELGGFAWFSEQLGIFLAPTGAQAPFVYDDTTFDLLNAELGRWREKLGCRLLLQNGLYGRATDVAMSEPAFFNRLYASGHCGTLLDLHILYMGERSGGLPMQDYLAQLDPNAVEEIHLSADDGASSGVAEDGDGGLTPAAVWRIACEHVPRFRRLRAMAFRFEPADRQRLGAEALVKELERLHELAAHGRHAAAQDL